MPDQKLSQLPSGAPIADGDLLYSAQNLFSVSQPASALVPYLASKGISNAPLGWFNVKNFGATGNGVTDDTTSINNAIAAFNAAGKGRLYFPAGTYLTSAGLTAITAVGTICGDGATNLNLQFGGLTPIAGSLITCTSSTAFLFTLSSQTIMIRDLALLNTSGITPTAGAGILVTSAITNQKVDYQNIQVSSFYINVDSRTGAVWSMHNAVIVDPVLHGLSCQNINTADAGDWAISNTAFVAVARGPTGAAVLQQSSGGGKLVNVKVNGAGGANRFVNGFDITAGSTSIFLLANVSIENYSGQALIFNNANLTMISNVEVGHYNNTTNPACSFTSCVGLIISGLVGAQSGGGTVTLANCNNSCSNVVIGSISSISGFTGGRIAGFGSVQNITGITVPLTGFTDVATLRAVTSGPIGCRFMVNNTNQAAPTLGQLVAAGDAGGTNTQPVFLDAANTWRYG